MFDGPTQQYFGTYFILGLIALGAIAGFIVAKLA
jgi:general stress protein CsbA